ncbi:MAG TPA: hypothetical protein VFE24_15285, partial [Pirellulales bacterium]|nr:hypothetical protein [Pirellulales bacterium]
PRVEISEAERQALAAGLSVHLAERGLPGPPAEVAAFDSAGNLLALIGPRADGRWWPLRNFTSSR